MTGAPAETARYWRHPGVPGVGLPRARCATGAAHPHALVRRPRGRPARLPLAAHHAAERRDRGCPYRVRVDVEETGRTGRAVLRDALGVGVAVGVWGVAFG